MSGQPVTTEATDDGLIDLGEQDDMFDPLVRSSSIGSRTGSLLRSSGSTSSQSAFAFLTQSSVKGDEATSSGNMFGAPPTTNVQQQPQQVGVAAQTMQPMMMGMNVMSSYVRNYNPQSQSFSLATCVYIIFTEHAIHSKWYSISTTTISVYSCCSTTSSEYWLPQPGSYNYNEFK